MMRRPGSVLSRVIRDAWDCRDLAVLTKNNPTRATGPHISIIGHITVDELLAKMDRTSMTNGYANRFLFACVRRARLLPHGGDLHDSAVRELAMRTRERIPQARKVSRVMMTFSTRRKYLSLTGRAKNRCLRQASFKEAHEKNWRMSSFNAAVFPRPAPPKESKATLCRE